MPRYVRDLHSGPLRSPVRPHHSNSRPKIASPPRDGWEEFPSSRMDTPDPPAAVVVVENRPLGVPVYRNMHQSTFSTATTNLETQPPRMEFRPRSPDADTIGTAEETVDAVIHDDKDAEENDDDDDFSVGTFKSLVSEQDKPRTRRLSKPKPVGIGGLISPRVVQRPRPRSIGRRLDPPTQYAVVGGKEVLITRKKSRSSKSREAPENPLFDLSRIKACLPISSARSDAMSTSIICPTDVWDSSRRRRRRPRKKDSKRLPDLKKHYLGLSPEDTTAEMDSDDDILEEIAVPQKKQVRFGSPLVTRVVTRPKTAVEDIPMLYFIEDELEILEDDRLQTPCDQFECSIDGGVEHVSRRQPVNSYFD